MPVPANTCRITLTWSAPSSWPGELAVNTFHVAPQDPLGALVPEVSWLADQYASVLIAHWTDIAGAMSSATHIAQLKIDRLDAAGHVVDQGIHVFASTDLQGSGSAGVMPPEVAVAVSQYNYVPGTFALKKGRHRGRMYMPYISQSLMGSNGKLNSGGAGLLATGWAEAFTAFNAIPVQESEVNKMGCVILSRAAGAVYEVNVIGVDDHFDAQRRRQHQSPSVLSTANVPAW